MGLLCSLQAKRMVIQLVGSDLASTEFVSLSFVPPSDSGLAVLIASTKDGPEVYRLGDAELHPTIGNSTFPPEIPASSVSWDQQLDSTPVIAVSFASNGGFRVISPW